jgi:hypothetical protein
MQVLPGQRYRHFKGTLYQIITLASDSETQAELVVYTSVEDSSKTWVRPLSAFCEEVSREGYSGPRFVFESGSDDVDCEHFVRGIPGGDCYSIGHYECRECQKLDPQSSFATGRRA